MSMTISCGKTRIILEDSSGFVLLEDGGYMLTEFESIEELPADGTHRVWNPDAKEPCRGSWQRPYAVWNPR